MAAPIISVNPELLRGKATEVRNLKGDHDDAIARLTTLVQDLNEIWKGDAQTNFVNQFESMKTTFTNFSMLLETYAKLMDETAAKMEENDASNTSSINSTLDSFK